MADPIVIKRYARSRLYDPAGCRYVCIDTLHAWAANQIAFVVLDAETQEDITQVLLA